MGGSYAKEADHVLKSDVERLKSCMYNHECNVHSIEASVKAQDASAQLLAELQNTPGSNVSGTLEKTGVILNSTQTSLSNQVGALCGSFIILDKCIEDISKRYSYETESPPGNTENRNTGSQMPAASKQVSHVHTSKRSSSNESLKKDATSRDVDKDEKIKSLKAENEAISSNINKLQMSLKRSEDKVKQLELEINTLLNFKEEARHAIHEKYELEKKYIKLENDNKRLNTEILSLKRKTDAMDSLLSKLDRSENDKRFLERTLEQLRRQVYDLEEEKRKVRERKKIVPVQLFYQRKDDLMALVVNELSSMLDTQMQTKGMHLEIIRCENIANIQPDKPILVLCINSSRLGTDASTAIEGVQRSECTALLIFHHKNIHALPNQPSDRMLTSSEFKQLGCIVDLAFLTGKGIYTCDMNNVALSYIEGFLQRNCPAK
ncbi:uncharacterized protein LOC132752361 [Ruditapes philippinarum]|uniref:uncharacterized protein LOC132752361 n=1 Tax=Ruditapes philippinarum TaxID=129788 RepID=UPI00295AFCFD|nr:uncharacterized protein LOC132752361 [Ruditapes philippinarum]